FGVSLLDVAILNPRATVAHDVEAYVGAGSDVMTNGGALTVQATSTGSAGATANGVDVGAVTVNKMSPTATGGGNTSAHIEGKVTTGSVDVAATSTRNANADLHVIGIGLLGSGASADANAVTDGVTLASFGGQANITATGNVTLEATSS